MVYVFDTSILVHAVRYTTSTATVLDATLLTSDNDFGHLSPRFFQVENVGKWQV
jgi:hypothetical protein